MDVAIIGTGPAALASAWAVTRWMDGHVTLYGPPRKSPLRGPLLLQRPLPGLCGTTPDGRIHQEVYGGTILDYRRKLYGDLDIGIDGDVLEPYYDAWQLAPVYDRLWEMFRDRIIPVSLVPDQADELVEAYDLTVNTAPANLFCGKGHSFISRPIAIVEADEFLKLRTPPVDIGARENTIIFDARDWWSAPWVRISNVFGYECIEFPPDKVPTGVVHQILRKPISTDCDCHFRGISYIRTGRFGKWKNETWIDTAYHDTIAALEMLER